MILSFAFKHCRHSSYFPIYFLIFANYAFLLKCVLEKILSGAFLIHNKIMEWSSGAYFCFFSVRLHFFLILLHFEFTSFTWLSDWFCMFSVLFNIFRFLFFRFFFFLFLMFHQLFMTRFYLPSDDTLNWSRSYWSINAIKMGVVAYVFNMSAPVQRIGIVVFKKSPKIWNVIVYQMDHIW